MKTGRTAEARSPGTYATPMPLFAPASRGRLNSLTFCANLHSGLYGGFVMLSMVRRFFGFSQPAMQPTSKMKPSSLRLGAVCSNSPSTSGPAIAPAAQQSAGVAAPIADSPAPAAAGPATNQATDWLAMRRSAGWQSLEIKPSGRHGETDDMGKPL